MWSIRLLGRCCLLSLFFLCRSKRDLLWQFWNAPSTLTVFGVRVPKWAVFFLTIFKKFTSRGQLFEVNSGPIRNGLRLDYSGYYDLFLLSLLTKVSQFLVNGHIRTPAVHFGKWCDTQRSGYNPWKRKALIPNTSTIYFYQKTLLKNIKYKWKLLKIHKNNFKNDDIRIWNTMGCDSL